MRSTIPAPGEIEAADIGVNVDGRYTDCKTEENETSDAPKFLQGVESANGRADSNSYHESLKEFGLS
ncbi:hypothetical protein Trydic_g9669 [Trypoxylus dichotomus]